jgi:hypothetical protein
MHEASPDVVQTLRHKILDCSTPIAAKWRALFALRNIDGANAETAMSDGKMSKTCSCEGKHPSTSLSQSTVL